MPFYCDYHSDIRIIAKGYKPNLLGVYLKTNKAIPAKDILSIISKYIPTNIYYELNHNSGCDLGLISIPRKIIFEDNNNRIEIDYPLPFTKVNWQNILNKKIKFKTVGEVISASSMNRLLI